MPPNQAPNDVSAPIVELLEQGLTVTRIENETQQAFAIQHPRSIKELTGRALEELRAFPAFANKAYYSIPYKDYTETPPKTVMVEGPSIKAANALVRHWGNNASGFRVVGMDEERILIQGVFLDYETNMRRTAEISVSRKARKRDGSYYVLAPDRLNMSIQAGGSKAVRNAIMNAMPVGLVDGYFAEAKSIAARGGKPPAADTGKGTPEDISAEMEQTLKAFENLGVPRAEVANYVIRHPELADEEQVVAHLIGLLNGIQDGQVAIQEVFAVEEAPIAEPQPAPAAKPAAPGSAPKAAPASKPKAPASFRAIDSKIQGGSCATCGKVMDKGVPIWFDTSARRAHHREHFI